MVMFWVVAALLLVGALLLLLPALWAPRAAAPGQAGGANVAVYRDQLREAERDLAADLITPDRFEQLRSEIQRRVLEDTQAASAGGATALRPARRMALGLALLIPAASIATYLALGEPGAMAPFVPPPMAASEGPQHEITPEQIQRMVAALAERMKAEPANPEGWLMLGRSYTALGRYADAVLAFRKASALMPGNANVLADLADAMGMAQDRRLAGEPARLVQQALQADPRNVKALALAGSVAFEAKDYAAARGYWERLVAVVPADSDIARSVQGSIAEARQLEGGAPAAAPAAPAAPPQVRGAPAAGVKLSGEVVLSPELAARVAPGDTLFVFARAAQGPRIPLAILRQPVGQWPVRFTLDDSMSMAPDLKLSAHAQVVVGARVSRSGDAMPQSGDLVGQSGTVAHTAQGLRIVIDKAQP
ncbi:MAG: c-type cytochrome biosis protein CcmI [Pseudomonadota bacterium]|jgi:cytochrome c-type biogenesis protein CcmH